jgi:hypothetical protein
VLDGHGLSDPGGADDEENLVLVDPKIHAPEDLLGSKGLVHVAEFDH